MSLFELKQEQSPLVISVPHDGALIPQNILATMNPGVLDSTDRDYLINEVFEFDDLKFSKIKANYSRHVIDLNRPASGEALYENQTETELCPTTTFAFKDIYQSGQKPTEEEIQRRIETYWQPYHEQLQALIDQAKAEFGYCILIDAHSIDDEVPRFFKGQLPDISVGTNNGLSCATNMTEKLIQALAKQQQFSWVDNGRFKGGFITRNYGQPEDGIHAIQLEHAKSSYLDDEMMVSHSGKKLQSLWQLILLDMISI